MPQHLKRTCLSACVAGACLAGVVGGCAHARKTQAGPSTAAMTLGNAMNPNLLNADVNFLADRIYTESMAMAGTIEAQTTSRTVREACLLWKIHTARAWRALRQVEDPRQRFVLLWLGAVQVRNRLKSKQGAELFGDRQAFALAAAKRMEDEVLAFGREHLSPQKMAAAVDDIEALAATSSVSMGAEDGGLPRVSLGDVNKRSDLMAILSVPLAPVEGLRGVGDTPAAITELARSADRINQTAQEWPQEWRWQAEFLLLESGWTDAVNRALEETRQMRQTLDAMQKTASELPKQVGDEANRSLQTVQQMQPELAKTLTQAQQTVAEARQGIEAGNQLVASLKQTIGELPGTVAAYESAAKETRLLIADIKSFAGEESNKQATTKPAGSGDSSAYTPAEIGKAAKQLQSAAAEIRGLLADLKAPPQQAPTRLDAAVDKANGLLTRAALYLAGLIGLTFLLAVVYRRMGKARTSGR